MAFDPDVIAQIRQVAADHGIEPAALLAVAEVESGGRAFVEIDGRRLPLILYEYHVFYRNLPTAKRSEAIRRDLARKRWGELPYKRSMPERYAQLQQAKLIDRQAAFAACSWGIGQVLGENAEWLGYASPEALANGAMRSVAGQVEVMLRFVERRGLRGALEHHDWRAFARGYNGPGQVETYSKLMAKAHRRQAESAPTSVLSDQTILRIGAKGEDVTALQNALRSLGYELSVDGAYGPMTKRMVTAFQRDNRLVADGIAGPKTLARIEALTALETL